jgi:hypothetical protein
MGHDHVPVSRALCGKPATQIKPWRAQLRPSRFLSVIIKISVSRCDCWQYRDWGVLVYLRRLKCGTVLNEIMRHERTETGTEIRLRY